MIFRQQLIFGNFEVPDSYQKICYKNNKEYCHTEMKSNKQTCSQIFSIKSCNLTHKYLVSVHITHTHEQEFKK